MSIDDAAALKDEAHVSVGFDKSIAVRKFLRSPTNWLLLFVPLTVALEHVHGLPATVLFFSAAVAILPIASLIVHGTEQLSTRTGDAIGGLLNATRSEEHTSELQSRLHLVCRL